MAAWLPVIKAAIPHLAQVVTVALPMFTSRSENADRDALIARQINELQEAATQNAESVKELATQLQSTFEGLESAATDLQRQLKQQKQLTVVMLILSTIAIGLGSLALIRI
jgi:predicted nucleotide-binding protein (sugar kinase/HSP70/actin superfamily)